MSEEKKARIRTLNDNLRRNNVGGQVVASAGFGQLDQHLKRLALERVRAFDDFTEGNDPHGEHDFGQVEVEGYQIFWKIDYYDKAVEYGSEDPSDAAQTHRVMTLMLSEEY